VHAEFVPKNLKGRDLSEEVGVDGRSILEWILGKQSDKLLTGFIWLRKGTSGGCCKHGNEYSVGLKGGEFHD
jgi:hypothetical protein